MKWLANWEDKSIVGCWEDIEGMSEGAIELSSNDDITDKLDVNALRP